MYKCIPTNIGYIANTYCRPNYSSEVWHVLAEICLHRVYLHSIDKCVEFKYTSNDENCGAANCFAGIHWLIVDEDNWDYYADNFDEFWGIYENIRAQEKGYLGTCLSD